MRPIPSASMFARHGDAAEALGGRIFRKEILRAGDWIHPVTGLPVSFTAADLAAIAAETNRWIAAQGGRIPLPDGHTFDAARTLGYVRSVAMAGDQMHAVIEAGDDEVAKTLGGRIRDVSVYLEPSVTDSKGQTYASTITHVAATPYPVISGMGNFVALSRGAGASEAAHVPVYQMASAKGHKMSPLQSLAESLGIVYKDDTQAADAIKAKVAMMDQAQAASATASKAATDATAAAVAAGARATQALSAKDGEVTALAAKITALEARQTARDTADCDAAIGEVTALAAKAGKPEAFAADRQKRVRDLWGRDRETARDLLALSREALAVPTDVSGVRVVAPASQAAAKAAAVDARETRIAMARAAGHKIIQEGATAFAMTPAGKVPLG